MQRYRITRPVLFVTLSLMLAPVLGGAIYAPVFSVMSYLHSSDVDLQVALIRGLVTVPLWALFGVFYGFIPALVTAFLVVALQAWWRPGTTLRVTLVAGVITYVWISKLFAGGLAGVSQPLWISVALVAAFVAALLWRWCGEAVPWPDAGGDSRLAPVTAYR